MALNVKDEDQVMGLPMATGDEEIEEEVVPEQDIPMASGDEEMEMEETPVIEEEELPMATGDEEVEETFDVDAGADEDASRIYQARNDYPEYYEVMSDEEVLKDLNKREGKVVEEEKPTPEKALMQLNPEIEGSWATKSFVELAKDLSSKAFELAEEKAPNVTEFLTAPFRNTIASDNYNKAKDNTDVTKEELAVLYSKLDKTSYQKMADVVHNQKGEESFLTGNKQEIVNYARLAYPSLAQGKSDEELFQALLSTDRETLENSKVEISKEDQQLLAEANGVEPDARNQREALFPVKNWGKKETSNPVDYLLRTDTGRKLLFDEMVVDELVRASDKGTELTVEEAERRASEKMLQNLGELAVELVISSKVPGPKGSTLTKRVVQGAATEGAVSASVGAGADVLKEEDVTTKSVATDAALGAIGGAAGQLLGEVISNTRKWLNLKNNEARVKKAGDKLIEEKAARDQAMAKLREARGETQAAEGASDAAKMFDEDEMLVEPVAPKKPDAPEGSVEYQRYLDDLETYKAEKEIYDEELVAINDPFMKQLKQEAEGAAEQATLRSRVAETEAERMFKENVSEYSSLARLLEQGTLPNALIDLNRLSDKPLDKVLRSVTDLTGAGIPGKVSDKVVKDAEASVMDKAINSVDELADKLLGEPGGKLLKENVDASQNLTKISDKLKKGKTIELKDLEKVWDVAPSELKGQLDDVVALQSFKKKEAGVKSAATEKAGQLLTVGVGVATGGTSTAIQTALYSTIKAFKWQNQAAQKEAIKLSDKLLKEVLRKEEQMVSGLSQRLTDGKKRSVEDVTKMLEKGLGLSEEETKQVVRSLMEKHGGFIPTDKKVLSSELNSVLETSPTARKKVFDKELKRDIYNKMPSEFKQELSKAISLLPKAGEDTEKF